MTASLLDDGRFAAAFLDRKLRPWIDLFADCLDAARAAGDVEESAHVRQTELGFVHHLANASHLVSLSSAGVVDHGMSREELTASNRTAGPSGSGARPAACAITRRQTSPTTSGASAIPPAGTRP